VSILPPSLSSLIIKFLLQLHLHYICFLTFISGATLADCSFLAFGASNYGFGTAEFPHSYQSLHKILLQERNSPL
jgi:hypothetical protein